MADVKISELTALTTPSGGDELVVNDSGTTKKITIEDLFAGDNVKAKFGAGDDLQIYHDGGHSRIKDVGTGNLVLAASTSVNIDGANGTNIAHFYESGVSRFYGNVGINEGSPLGNLHVKSGESGATVDGSANELVVEGSGNSGISILSGSSSGGQIYFGDSELNYDGYLAYSHASRNMTLGTAGAGRLNINSAGNVGIGVVPETWDPIMKVLRIGGGGAIRAESTSVGLSQNSYYDDVSNRWEYIATDEASDYYQLNGTHNWRVAASGSADAAISWTTAMSIANNGFMTLAPNTSMSSGGVLNLRRNDNNRIIETMSFDASTQHHHVFENNSGTNVGSITVSTSATAYNTSSDYRLKENVTPMSGATAQTKLLKPCNFDWITGGNVNGFIAHELAEVVPEAVTGTKDAMRDEEYEVTPATGDVFTPSIDAYVDADENEVEAIAEVIHSADVEQPETLEEGQQWRETTAQVMGTRSVPDMQGIDQAKLVPLLTATIQELIARIEALEA